MAVRHTHIETVTHHDKRANIPMEELRDFVAGDEQAPGKVLYPRDPSLDPQLVWKGKDEQDREDLAVPTVPVYIQEKIQPRAIIEDLRSESARATPQQVSLFDDFGDLDWEQQIEFYQHEQSWTNRMILGDSLLVMSSLSEKEGLKGKVQTIYIDPPYGIRFGSNWQVSTRKRDVKDGKAEDATRQPEQVKAFRDTWELGIHSYLAYLRDRLVVARDLLTETGSVFVQIGDENVHLVRCLMDEVFGSENFVSLIQFRKTGYASTVLLPNICDYVLWCAKDREQLKYRPLYQDRVITEADTVFFDTVETPEGKRRSLSREERQNPRLIPKDHRILARNPLVSPNYIGSLSQPIEFDGKQYQCPPNAHWKTTPSGIAKLITANRMIPKGNTLRMVRYLEDFAISPFTNIWMDTGVGGFVGDERLYVVQTDTRVIQRCLLMTTDPGDLVLDPTCGSGTSAYVAEQWGRRWITCDTSRVALALARTRLMSARYPYYLLADSPEGVRKEAEITGRTPPTYKTEGDVRKGFVYRRVPHVTLKSIANNPNIREGMTREEIDAAIKKHADTELLYDQPFEDPKRIRVTGPFTVESLSPHRVLSTEEERPESEARAENDPASAGFEVTVLDNLRKAGVQNTVKDERLRFDRLEPFAGTWIHAEGEYTEKDGTPRRVAVSIGPEHGTVGSAQVKEAAKEAMHGAGFDLLVVCAFAFEAHAGETAKEFSPAAPKQSDGFAIAEERRQYGKLPILLARMNPDLAMGDELLKKTGSGNLFMVFGEPDLEVDRRDGKLIVTIHGVDVYDPTTGQIRSSTTDDIACWFIDTDYNEESFFVRHAYFTGADQPYDRLKRALKAEIDEAAWSTLYSATSRPFDPPSTGKIAVKVINHYGDEVLKVYDVGA